MKVYPLSHRQESLIHQIDVWLVSDLKQENEEVKVQILWYQTLNKYKLKYQYGILTFKKNNYIYIYMTDMTYRVYYYRLRRGLYSL